jgi:hypothetical protein
MRRKPKPAPVVNLHQWQSLRRSGHSVDLTRAIVNCRPPTDNLPAEPQDSRLTPPPGLMELDREGNVCAYQATHDTKPTPHGIVGRNFFTTFAAMPEVAEFRAEYADFLAGAALSARYATESIRLTFLRLNSQTALVLCKLRD